MLRFLREHELPKTFRKLKKDASEIIIAVPFWGTDALSMLELEANQAARIICNLASAACNPYVIEQLTKLRGIKVSSHPRLHAKIYATPSIVIVGSSNASTKGLTIEGEDPNSWIEGNVLSDDPNLISAVSKFFEDTWASKETEEITTRSHILRNAKIAWDSRPKRRFGHYGSSMPLFAACRQYPDLFDLVFVAAYEQGLYPQGKQKLAEVKRGTRQLKQSLQATDFKNAWGYQMSVTPGSRLIDLDCCNLRKPIVQGCCKVTELCIPIDGEDDLAIAIRGKITLQEFARPFKLSAKEKEALTKNAKRLLNQSDDGVIPLKEAIRIIDKPLGARKSVSKPSAISRPRW